MAVRYKVGELMVTNIVASTPNESVYDCARKMAHKNVGSLVVVDELALAGIITEQDITRKVVAKGLNPRTTPVSTVMSSNVESIESNKDIQEAIELMGKKMIKHLPVVDQGKIVGIIAAKDIVAMQPFLIEMVQLNGLNQQPKTNIEQEILIEERVEEIIKEKEIEKEFEEEYANEEPEDLDGENPFEDIEDLNEEPPFD